MAVTMILLPLMAVLSMASACKTGTASSSPSPLPTGPAQAGLKYHDVDWSSVLAEERSGVVYKNPQGVEMPLENIPVEAGVNIVRQRVWTVDGDHGIDYNLKLARRATDAGLLFGLNLHYSDGWTNPGLQGIPTGWPEDIDALEARL